MVAMFRIPALATTFACLLMLPATAGAVTDPTNGGRGYVRSERSLSRTSVDGLNALWSAPSGSGDGAALLGADSVFVSGTPDGPGVRALDPVTGDESWAWTAGDGGDATAPVRSGAHLLVTAQDGIVTALDRDSGAPVWARKVEGGHPAVVAAFNRVFVSTDTALTTLDAGSGRVRWSQRVDAPQGMAVSHGWLFTTQPGVIVSRGPARGDGRWKEELPQGDTVPSTPFLSKFATFVTAPGGDNGELQTRAYDSRSGKLQWVATVGRDGCADTCRPATPVADDARVYAATPSGRLTALDRRTGEERWAVQLRSPTAGDPVLSASGVVFVADTDGALTALDARTGRALWERKLESPAVAGPALGLSTVAVRTKDGRTTTFALDAVKADSRVSARQARDTADRIGVRFEQETFTLQDFRTGLSVEIAQRAWEHGSSREEILVRSGKLAYEHLRAEPDYYSYLSGEVTAERALAAVKRLGDDLGLRGITVEQLRLGMAVELAHATWDNGADNRADVDAKAAEIALRHLAELPEYYVYLSGISVTEMQANAFAELAGVSFGKAKFTLAQLRLGMSVELRRRIAESGPKVTDEDLIWAGKVALEHLNASARYYDGAAISDVTVVKG